MPTLKPTDRARCEKCDTVYEIAELKAITRLHERVKPGEEMPAGECAKCGALCHLLKMHPRIASHLSIEDEMALVCDLYERLENSPRACVESGAGTEDCIALQEQEGKDPGNMEPERMCIDCRAVFRAQQLDIALTDIAEADCL
jgi:hypothetical protein